MASNFLVVISILMPALAASSVTPHSYRNENFEVEIGYPKMQRSYSMSTYENSVDPMGELREESIEIPQNHKLRFHGFDVEDPATNQVEVKKSDNLYLRVPLIIRIALCPLFCCCFLLLAFLFAALHK